MYNLKVTATSAYLLSDLNYRRYFSGINIEEGYLLKTCDKTFYFTDSRYYGRLISACKPSITPVLYKGMESIKAVIDEIGIKRIYIDFDTTTLTEYKSLQVLGEIKDGTAELKNCRSIKTESEIECIKKACEITERCFYRLVKEINLGVTESYLKDLLNGFYIEEGSTGESFETIVAFGSNSAIPHHKTGDTVLTENTVILIDTGCFYNGYASDYTRTLFFGTPNSEFLTSYDAVLNSNELSIKNIREGIECKAADGIARSYLEDMGYGKYFTHSLGHGLGLEIHEYPTLSPKSDATVKENMVFTIEPGVYFDGKFGIRIEDTVVIKDGKVQRLFTDDKNLIIL